MTAEEWRPVVGHPGYEVSSFGRILSHHRGGPRILRGTLVKGYRRVSLRGNRTQRPVHQLVAEAFIGPRPDGLEVRHLDGVKTNCAVDNLAYGTQSANALDKVRHGAHHNARKTHCANGHPFDAANTYRIGTYRFCRTCRRGAHLAYKQRIRSAEMPISA